MRRRDGDAAVLRLLQGEAFAGESDVGARDEGVVGALGDVDGGGGDAFDPSVVGVVLEADVALPVAGGVVVDAFFGDAGEGDAGVDLEGRPGQEAGGDLIGEHFGVGCGVEDLLCHDSGDLVVAVAVRDVAGEDRCDDERAGETNLTDDVVEDAVMAPGFERFFEGLGEAEVGYAGEGLVDAEVVTGGEELLGAKEAELIPVVGRHDVLSAFATVEGEESSVDALFAGFVGEHAGVLIVGMGDDENEAGAGVEFLQALPDGGGAAVDGERRSEGGGIGDRCLGLRGDGVADECGGQGEAERRGGKVVTGCIQTHRRNSYWLQASCETLSKFLGLL